MSERVGTKKNCNPFDNQTILRADKNQTCLPYPGEVECGGPPPPPENECYQPVCGAGMPCPAGQACVPGGAFGKKLNTCIPADCHYDSDCTARAGGRCFPFFFYTYCFPALHCHYQGDACAVDADCSDPTKSCRWQDNKPQCLPPMPPPPSPAF
eukprot:m.52206 g.52206  ORF g.52206 m.52206 type:complete len:154 (-) comp15308_c0_seq2:61-522(-)